MALELSTNARNAAVNGHVDLIDVSAPGSCEIYSGAPPANVGDTPAGTLLVTCDFGNPAFGAGGASVAGRADANAISPGTVVFAATAGCFLIKDGAGAVISQGTAGVDGDTPDMSFGPNPGDADLEVGGTVSITSMQITQPI